MDFSSLLDNFNLATFGQIMFANVVLSGDNAVLIGLAAAGLPAAQRSRAILFGMVFATVLRVIFSIFAVYLLEVPGLLLIGGLLLLWIAYGFFKELREEKEEEENPEEGEFAPSPEPKSPDLARKFFWLSSKSRKAHV